MKYIALWAFIILLLVLFFGGILKRCTRWWKCSWCKWYFSDDGQMVPYRRLADASEPISHGMCPSCVKKREEEEKLRG